MQFLGEKLGKVSVNTNLARKKKFFKGFWKK